MGSLCKNIQFMLVYLKVPFYVLHFSYYTLMSYFLDDVICNIAIYADDQASDLLKQLEWGNSNRIQTSDMAPDSSK